MNIKCNNNKIICLSRKVLAAFAFLGLAIPPLQGKLSTEQRRSIATTIVVHLHLSWCWTERWHSLPCSWNLPVLYTDTLNYYILCNTQRFEIQSRKSGTQWIGASVFTLCTLVPGLLVEKCHSLDWQGKIMFVESLDTSVKNTMETHQVNWTFLDQGK